MQSNRLNFEGQNIYIGIDVHLKSWTVSIFTERVKMKPFSQDPDASILYAHLQKNFPGGNYFSAYESGFSGFSVHYQLVKYGINNIVFNAADINDSHKERVRKTDAVDSSKIARNLRDGELTAIYVPSQEELSDRQLIRTRQTLVKNQTQTKIRIKSFLNFYGISCPKEIDPTGSGWTRRYLEWLKETVSKMPDGQRKSGEYLVRDLEYQHTQVLAVSRDIRELIHSPKFIEDYRLLTTVPGIGFTIAATILLEIGDINRFQSSDRLASFIGLVPDTRSTGDNEGIMGITTRSNRHLRELFTESAWRAIRVDPALAMVYENLCKRMKATNAIVRIARKLVNRVMYVLKNKKTYVCAVVR